MLNISYIMKTFNRGKIVGSGTSLVVATLLMTAQPNGVAKDNPGQNKVKSFEQINLVSDLPGVAQIQDPDLVNAWGVSFGAATPFWVSDNGTGKATLYAVTNDANGSPHVAKQGLIVQIPGEGNPSGQVFNGTTNFHGDLFLFVSEDGTISGWRGALGTNAEILATSPGAVYKGVTLASVGGATFLLAANFSQGTVDVYDGTATLVGQLADPDVGEGYAPFNVQSLNGTIFVTYAKQDADKHDDVAGAGHGLIDVLVLETQTFHRFATGSDAGGHLKAINSPWGLAIAPDTFGDHAGDLLVGNFGSGTIMDFDVDGSFKGFLDSKPGKPVTIDGLWALTVGNGGRGGVPGALYFTAGPDGENHGLFGSLEAVPKKNGKN